MAGDISRSSFQVLKANTGVRLQQGRLITDADWNEQLDIQAYREGALATDLVGSAAPENAAGFGIAANGNVLTVGPGRMYVDGILCENLQACQVMPTPKDAGAGTSAATNQGTGFVPSQPGIAISTFQQRVDIAQLFKANMSSNSLAAEERLSSVTVSAAGTGSTSSAPVSNTSPSPAALPVQPFLPLLPANIQAGAAYVAYLDVWERDITALEDPSIREVALGGPDTTTRTRVVWQVKLIQAASASCPTSVRNLLQVSSGEMSARAAASDAASTPCVIPAAAGYRSLENQLYRVEVHTAGKAGTSTFKWSRDNGSVVVGWQGGDTDLSVSSLGRDDVLGYAGGQWVELTDDAHEYAGAPGILVQLSNAQLVGQVPTLSLNTASTTQAIHFADFAGTPKVRRWDQTATGTTSLNGGAVTVVEGQWIDLENGVQVFFQPGGYYNTGDFWLIPARTATTASQPAVLWPVDGTNSPVPQVCEGIRHHYAALAVVSADNQGQWTVACDCRATFAPLNTPAAVRVMSVETAEKSPISVLPYTVLSPLSLLSGLRVACNEPLSVANLNVATLSVSLDLPETDEKFAESAVPGQQVPAAVSVKVMGNYGLSGDGTTVTWVPFPSARAYFLSKLAGFGVVTATQGRALTRLSLVTSAVKAGHCSSQAGEGKLFSLPAWTLAYMDNSVISEPLFERPGTVIGPDASGDYIATGFMSNVVFALFRALPLLDVSGNKLYSTPMTIKPGTQVYAYVPTAAERTGNFSTFSLPVLDPRTGGPFPGNQIPVSEWPGSPTGALGVFAVRFRAYVPAPVASYGYGYGGSSAIGGTLI